MGVGWWGVGGGGWWGLQRYIVLNEGGGGWRGSGFNDILF